MGSHRLEGQTAIVTGGGQGIGRACALSLADAGAHVMVNDARSTAAVEVAEEVAAAGGKSSAFSSNVSHREEVEALVEATISRAGSVDILINNAGLLQTTAIESITAEEWDLLIEVNLKGVFLCTQAVLPTMKAQRSGHIVNVASLAGKATSTLGGAHYTAAKAGVLGFSRHTAREVGPFHINVNAVCPGIVATPMVEQNVDEGTAEKARNAIPFGRYASPEEVADLVLFLASDESRYITGAAVDIHGGELILQ